MGNNYYPGTKSPSTRGLLSTMGNDIPHRKGTTNPRGPNPYLCQDGTGTVWGTKYPLWDCPTMKNASHDGERRRDGVGNQIPIVGLYPMMTNDGAGMGWDGEPNPHCGIASHDEKRWRDGAGTGWGTKSIGGGLHPMMGNYGAAVGWGTKSP